MIYYFLPPSPYLRSCYLLWLERKASTGIMRTRTAAHSQRKSRIALNRFVINFCHGDIQAGIWFSRPLVHLALTTRNIDHHVWTWIQYLWTNLVDTRICNNPWTRTRNWSMGYRQCRKTADYLSGVRHPRRLRHFLTTRRRVRRWLLAVSDRSNLSLIRWRRMIKARVAASVLLCDVGAVWCRMYVVPGGFRPHPPPFLVFLFFTPLVFAAFMHIHDPLSMITPSFLLLPRYTFYPDPNTPTSSSNLAVFVAFFLLFLLLGTLLASTLFSTLIPISSFTTPTISNYLLIHPTYDDTTSDQPSASLFTGPSLCRQLYPTQPKPLPNPTTYPSCREFE